MGSHLWMREADSINHFCFGVFFLRPKTPQTAQQCFAQRGPAMTLGPTAEAIAPGSKSAYSFGIRKRT